MKAYQHDMWVYQSVFCLYISCTNIKHLIFYYHEELTAGASKWLAPTLGIPSSSNPPIFKWSIFWVVATQILFISTPIFGEMMQFDEHIAYFSKGLKPLIIKFYCSFFWGGVDTNFPTASPLSLSKNRRPQDVAPCLYLMSMTFVAHCFAWPCPRVLAVNKPLMMRQVFGCHTMFNLGGMMWPLSAATVDGWNPANRLRLVVDPIIYKVLYIPGGAGFPPSTVGSLIYLCMFIGCSSLSEKIQFDDIILVQLGDSTTNQSVANLI